MGIMKNRFFLYVFVSVAFAMAVNGGTLKVDKELSAFGVDVKASPPHSFTVIAKNYAAEVDIDAAGEVMAATFSFEFADLDSDSNGRDKKMRKWMDVETHPQMRFELTEVRHEGESRIGVGKIWMHGVSQEIEVPFSVEVENGTATLSGTATLDYQNWGLEIISILFFKVKPELNIHFTLVGSVE